MSASNNELVNLLDFSAEDLTFNDMVVSSSTVIMDFFNVHTVAILEVMTMKNDPMDCKWVSDDTTWVCIDANHYQSDNNVRKYKVNLVPYHATLLATSSVESVKAMKSFAKIQASPDDPFNVDIEFPVAMRGFSLAKIAQYMRTHKYLSLLSQNASEKEARSLENWFIYFDGNSILSNLYSGIMEATIDEVPKGFVELGFDLTVYNTRVDSVFRILENSQANPRKYTKDHRDLFFDTTFRIISAVGLNPFRTYNLDFADKAVPAGKYFNFRTEIHAGEDRPFYHYFGVIE